MTLYGDSSTVFFNVKYKDNGTDIDNRSGQPLDISQAVFQ